jgi:putative FmdB family regulatory protein
MGGVFTAIIRASLIMPTYSYKCNNCEQEFELFFYIKDYTEQPPCPACKSNKTIRLVSRDVMTQNMSVKKADNELKTIGDIANRNRDRLSEDEKKHLFDKHNSYKNEQSNKKLPSGMTRLKKQPKTKWT